MDIVTYGALNKKVGEKLSSNQGTQNAGKMLGINNEGEIQPIQVLGGNVSVTETLESGEDYSMVIEEGEPTAVTSVAGKYGTVTLDAGDIEYDEQEVYNSGTVGKEVGDLKSQITEISEVEHSKNMFDEGAVLAAKSGITYADGVYTGTSQSFSNAGVFMSGDFAAGKQYTLSVYAYTDASAQTNGFTINIRYTDSSVSREYFPNNTSSFIRKSVTSDITKTIDAIYFGYASGYANVWHVKNIQVEEGATATEYVEPSDTITALDKVARARIDDIVIPDWRDKFSKEFLRIAYSAIWVDKANTATHWLFASDMGFNVLKGDVEITSDGKLIMCHDPGFTFDENGRITTYDAANKTLIANMTYAECRSKFYADNPARYGDYCPVADIDDFLRICKENGKIAFVTIRATNTTDVVDELADKIILYGMESRTIINALSISLLEVVRNNSKCDSIAINYVAAENTAITTTDVDSCERLGKCFLSIWCNSSTSVIDDSVTAIAYAQAHNVPLLAGSIGSIEMYNYLIEHGVLGTQIYKPLFNVTPRSYRFAVKVDDGVPAFANLFASDRFVADVSISGNVVSVANIKINGSYLQNVIDGLQPIQMNMLNPDIRCINNAGDVVACVWENNALKITLPTTDDATYTVIVTV